MYHCDICNQDFKQKGNHQFKHDPDLKKKCTDKISSSLIGNIPVNKGTTGKQYKSYKKRTKTRKLTEKEKSNIKIRQTGSNNSQYGDKYTYCNKQKSCLECGRIVNARGYGQHLLSHNLEYRKVINRKISLKRLEQIIPFHDTLPERILQEGLQKIGISFIKHKSILGFCQTDLFIEPNICIFCDGDYWHNLPERIERDSNVNQFLLDNNFISLRFWEHEIHLETNKCLNTIKRYC